MQVLIPLVAFFVCLGTYPLSSQTASSCKKGEVCCKYDQDRAPDCMSRHECLATYSGKILDSNQCTNASQGTSSAMPLSPFQPSSLSLEDTGLELEEVPIKYLYHPDIGLVLGEGYSPSDPREFKSPCIIKEDTPPLNPGPPKTTFHYTYVGSSDRMLAASSVDVAVEARYLGAQAKFSSHASTSELNSSNSITVVITAESDYGRWSIKPGAHLTDAARDWVQANDWVDFARSCGERYVIAEGRGSSASAILTIFSVTQDFKSAMNSAVSISGNVGALEGDAKIAFSKELAKAATQQRVTAEAFANGGSGISGLESLVKAAVTKEDAEAQITSHLGSYLATFTKENPAITTYYTRPMVDFGYKPPQPTEWTLKQEEGLRKIASDYNTIYEDRLLASQFVDGSHPLSRVFPQWKTTFSYDIQRSDAYLSDLKAAHSRCMVSTPSSVSECGIPTAHAMTFTPMSTMVRTFMMPPRLGMLSLSLTEDQLRAVLNQPPEARSAMAAAFNPAATEFAAMLQVKPGRPHIVLTWTLEFDSPGQEPWRPFVDATGNAGWVWWETGQNNNVEDSLKTAMASWSGDHDGVFYEVITSQTGAKYRVPFMKAHWNARNKKLFAYSYELVF